MKSSLILDRLRYCNKLIVSDLGQASKQANGSGKYFKKMQVLYQEVSPLCVFLFFSLLKDER